MQNTTNYSDPLEYEEGLGHKNSGKEGSRGFEGLEFI